MLMGAGALEVQTTLVCSSLSPCTKRGSREVPSTISLVHENPSVLTTKTSAFLFDPPQGLCPKFSMLSSDCLVGQHLCPLEILMEFKSFLARGLKTGASLSALHLASGAVSFLCDSR